MVETHEEAHWNDKTSQEKVKAAKKKAALDKQAKDASSYTRDKKKGWGRDWWMFSLDLREGYFHQTLSPSFNNGPSGCVGTQ